MREIYFTLEFHFIVIALTSNCLVNIPSLTCKLKVFETNFVDNEFDTKLL